MSLKKLEDIYNNIDSLEKLSISLDGKIRRTESEKAEEEAVQHLMKFELTKITNHLEKLRREVAKLDLDYSRSVATYQNCHKLYNEFARGQRSITILKEIEERSKSRYQRNLRRMGFTQDERDEFHDY